MASLYATPLLLFTLLLLLLPWDASFADLLNPTFSPNLDDDDYVCKEVECGKGNCKPKHDSFVGFECECDPGWSHPFNFLPCVIPNCTLNYSCGGSAAPVVNKPDHPSIINPCHWVDCGVGVCKKTSTLSYECECNDGYFNLLNVTAFPCLKQCALGMDCVGLGLDYNTTTPLPPPILSHSSSAKDGFIVGGGFDWLITIAALLAAMLLLK